MEHVKGNEQRFVPQFAALPLGRPVSGYDIVRVVLAGVLLVAAALKGYQLATGPTVETGLLTARWVLIGTVEFEILLGLWLLSGIFVRRLWQISLGCFALFACVSLYKALAGEASCGCFGRVEVNPWYTFTLDVAAVLALLRWRPSRATSMLAPSRALALHGAAMTFLWLAISIPSAMAMAGYQPTMLSEDGIILGNDNLVILEPEKWVGERFPLLDYIDIGDKLREGSWIVVLYHHDCPECRASMPKYEQLARRSVEDPTAPRVALIEVPPYGKTNGRVPVPNLKTTFGRLNEAHDWFAATPAEAWLTNGEVVAETIQESDR